jgi:branched-chain amino acid transport system substrate-binding protein
VARERADALVYAGVPFWGPSGKEPPAFPFVRELRTRVRDVLLLGPDSWMDPPAVFAELGDAARGIHVSFAGVPLERLGPAGDRFVAEFGAAQPGAVVTLDAVYAAQATEVMLDAIARSDGSRASVTRALLDTHIEDGLIGDVSFNEHGDVRPRTFAIVRLARGPRTLNGVLPGGRNLAAVISP